MTPVPERAQKKKKRLDKQRDHKEKIRGHKHIEGYVYEIGDGFDDNK